MKSLSFAMTTLFFPIVFGCGHEVAPWSDSPSIQSMGIPVHRHVFEGETTPLTALDSEADKGAAKTALVTWKPTKIGDSHYIEGVHNELRELFELRGHCCAIITPEEIHLSEADRLNGIEIRWQGQVSLHADLIRSYSYRTKKWSNWKDDGMFTMRLTDDHGEWKAEPGSIVYHTTTVVNGKPFIDDSPFGECKYTSFRKVEAGEIPK